MISLGFVFMYFVLDWVFDVVMSLVRDLCMWLLHVFI